MRDYEFFKLQDRVKELEKKVVQILDVKKPTEVSAPAGYCGFCGISDCGYSRPSDHES